MDLYLLRQGLHVIGTSWDYHGGAEGWILLFGNPVRYTYIKLISAVIPLPQPIYLQGSLSS
jgi:hypothetical protein